MNKFQEIRPIALGIAKKNHQILVSIGYDEITKETFYRCLGGGIEFLEKSTDALKREFMEEIGVNITIDNFLGVFENIFTYNGKAAHEHIFFYKITIPDEAIQEKYTFLEGDIKNTAVWMNIDDFIQGKAILYPKETLKYLT